MLSCWAPILRGLDFADDLVSKRMMASKHCCMRPKACSSPICAVLAHSQQYVGQTPVARRMKCSRNPEALTTQNANGDPWIWDPTCRGQSAKINRRALASGFLQWQGNSLQLLTRNQSHQSRFCHDSSKGAAPFDYESAPADRDRFLLSKIAQGRSEYSWDGIDSDPVITQKPEGSFAGTC